MLISLKIHIFNYVSVTNVNYLRKITSIMLIVFRTRLILVFDNNVINYPIAQEKMLLPENQKYNRFVQRNPISRGF